MSKSVELTGQNFDSEVIGSKIPVLVDFWAEWCGPCKALGPTLEEIAKEPAAGFKIAKVNVDEYPELATRFNVMNIPTMILFKKGEEVDRIVGLMPKAKILAKINSII